MFVACQTSVAWEQGLYNAVKNELRAKGWPDRPVGSEFLIDAGTLQPIGGASVPPVPQQLTDEEVLAALRRIPPQYQEIIVLCDVEEMTYKEIADALGVPVGTVMSRLHRGRALLRAELSQPSQGEGERWHSAGS